MSAVAAAALSLAGCGGGSSEAPQAQIEAVEIGAIAPKRESLTEPVVATGTIAAAKTTDVGPSVDGIIEEVFVKVGDRVEAGQPLFKTRDVEYRLQVEQAKQNVALAQAQAANARRVYERAEKLKAEGAAAQGRLEEARTASEVADAQLGIAQSRLAAAEQALTDCTVVAPFAGAITRRDVDPGRFMATRMPGGMGGGASGVVQLMDLSIVGAIVTAPEPELKRLRVGQRAVVTVDATAQTYETQLHVINDKIDWQTRSVELRLAIANPGYEIKPGSFVRAEIFPDPREAVTLERRAVLGPEGGRYVYVARDGKAARMPVKTRDLDATRVEIVEGLAEADQVLAGPALARIYDGAAVTIVVAPEPAPRTAAAR